MILIDTFRQNSQSRDSHWA